MDRERRRVGGGLRAILAWLLLAAPALALQEEGASPEPEPAPGFPSPRAAIEHFLERMHAFEFELAPGADEDAAEALALGEGMDGAELARQLYGILNRTTSVDLAHFPAAGSPELSGRTHWTWVHVPPGAILPVGVGFERLEGGWLVDRETLRRVPRLWERMASLPVAAEFRRTLPALERLRYDVREALPAVLSRKSFLGVENWQWAGLGVLLFGAVVLDRLVRVLLGRLLARVLRARGSFLSSDALSDFERPVGILVAALVFGALLPVLGIDPTYANPLHIAVGFVAAVAGIWAAYRLVDVLCEYLAERAARTQNRFDDVLVPLLRRTLKILLTIVALFFLASRWTEDLWGIVAGLSIGSLAVGFAARDSIENLFGTFTVLLDKPFELGDWVTVGEIDGTVEAVGFRSTRVRTFYNSLITVPNRLFISAHVDNWGRRRYRRVKTTLGLTYDTPPALVEAFCEGVRELIRRHPYTRKDSYHVYFNDFGASSLNVLLYCFVETPDWATELRERHRLLSDILAVAERLGVSFAFPTQSLHLVKPEDLEHPDAPEDATDARERGRSAARDLTASLAGDVPPPVSFD